MDGTEEIPSALYVLIVPKISEIIESVISEPFYMPSIIHKTKPKYIKNKEDGSVVRVLERSQSTDNSYPNSKISPTDGNQFVYFEIRGPISKAALMQVIRLLGLYTGLYPNTDMEAQVEATSKGSQGVKKLQEISRATLLQNCYSGRNYESPSLLQNILLNLLTSLCKDICNVNLNIRYRTTVNSCETSCNGIQSPGSMAVYLEIRGPIYRASVVLNVCFLALYTGRLYPSAGFEVRLETERDNSQRIDKLEDMCRLALMRIYCSDRQYVTVIKLQEVLRNFITTIDVIDFLNNLTDCVEYEHQRHIHNFICFYLEKTARCCTELQSHNSSNRF